MFFFYSINEQLVYVIVFLINWLLSFLFNILWNTRHCYNLYVFAAILLPYRYFYCWYSCILRLVFQTTQKPHYVHPSAFILKHMLRDIFIIRCLGFIPTYYVNNVPYNIQIKNYFYHFIKLSRTVIIYFSLSCLLTNLFLLCTQIRVTLLLGDRVS